MSDHENKGPEPRLWDALQVAICNKEHDGDHHKDWVIDQMVRHLTGCPVIEKSEEGRNWTELGENEIYLAVVALARKGDDGPETYNWEISIAP